MMTRWLRSRSYNTPSPIGKVITYLALTTTQVEAVVDITPQEEPHQEDTVAVVQAATLTAWQELQTLAEVEVAVKGLTSMIEPIVIVIMGIVIGGIVIAMFIPMFELGQLAGKQA